MDNEMKMLLKGRRILFATVPSDGHINPLTGLAKYLKDEMECDVRWYTASIYREKITRLSITHYSFITAKEITAENVNEVLVERDRLTDPIKRLNYDMIHIFGERGPEYYQDIENIYKSFPFELMIADNLFTGIPFVKHLMHVPVVAVGIIPLIEKSLDVAPYGSGMYPPKTAEERENNVKMHQAFGELVRESSNVFAAILTTYGIKPSEGAMADMLLREADVYLQIGVPSFEYPRKQVGKNIQFIGALMPYAKKINQPAWTDNRLQAYRKIVLVTQGTVEHDVNKIIVPALEAFAGTDTLVVATTGGNGTAALRERFPAENLIIEDYIPFQDIMPYADVFVTNGGYGGTLLGIQHQLPIVAAGVHEGKNEVCARIGYFEYGINLQTETPTAAAIRNAVNEVIGNQKYRMNVARLVEEMELYPSTNLCTKAITRLLYRTPASAATAAGSVSAV